MSELRYPQWRDENDHCKYPFSPRASLANDYIEVPENLFIDAKLYPIGGSQDQFLSSIVKTDTEIVFNVSDAVAGVLASGTYSVSTPSIRNTVHLQDAYGRSAGVLVTDSAHVLPVLSWPAGTFEFTLDQTCFACGVIVPMPAAGGLRSLRASDSDTAITEDLYIVGGRGVALEAAVDGSEILVTVHAMGEPLYKQLTCQNTTYINPKKLKTINGIKPDKYGNFQIVPCCQEVDNTLIRIDPIANGIRITVAGK